MNQAKAGGGLTRRRFLQAGMLAGAGALATGTLGGCAPKAPEIPDADAQVRAARTYWLGEEPVVAEGDIVAEYARSEFDKERILSDAIGRKR